MSHTHRPARTRLSTFRHFLLTGLALLTIVCVGAYFRTLNLSAWDGYTSQHPDERFMHYTVVNLSVPHSWRTYFTSVCPDPMPAPRNPQDEPAKWEPSLQSGCSTLNPRNFNWSRGYVYGTLPTTLTRIVVEALDRTETHQIVVTGRALSVGADLITLLATFYLASLLYDRRVGLLAAVLYAGAVMPIQQSHYFTVDQFAVCFGTLALVWTTRMALHGGWLNAVFTGVFIGAAVASKVNMAALALLVPGALLLYGRRSLHAQTEQRRPHFDKVLRLGIHTGLLLFVTGCVSFVAFRIFQPDAFTGPHIWNIAPEPRFLERLGEARLTASGEVDLPSSHQWADRTPWLFPWQNMVIWGMGLPLGLAAWAGWMAAGVDMLARRHLRHFLLWFWVALYFGWQGGQFVTTMRYFLPLYPPLIILGAWGLVRLVEYVRAGRLHRPTWLKRGLPAAGMPAHALALGAVALVLGSTLLWAWAYTRIYTRPYTRVAAADWIRQNTSDGAVTTWELWDDPLPLHSPIYTQIATHPYAEEEPGKYLSTFDANTQASDGEGLVNQLARTDYVVLTSPRIYDSVKRVPQRFPVVIRYYQSLFDGSLGFELAADVHSFPTLGTIPINDQAADEAFWVYDHPHVLIFRRTEDFSVERARQLLLDDVTWGEIYRGLRPVQLNAAPTALQLSATTWERLQHADARYLFNDRLGPAGSILVWLLAVELLGLAAAGLLWKWQIPLADRGLGLGRMLGLALFAVPPGLLATTQLAGISRILLAGWFVLLLACGGWLLWRERLAMLAYARVHRRAFWTPQLVYLLALCVGGVLYALMGTQLSAQSLARWTALVRTPTLPPPDLFFAGGLDPLPYAAQLPFALLDKLLGLQPSTGLVAALLTAFALAVVGLWSAVSAGLLRASHRSAALGWMLFGLLLILLPGLLIGDAERLTVWHALIRHDLDTLGLAALAATTLALGSVMLHHTTRPAGLLLLPLLPLVRGYGLWITAALWLVLALQAWMGLHGKLRPWLLRCGVLLVMFGLGQGFVWSVAPPAAELADFVLTTPSLLLGLLLPVGLLVALAMASGTHLASQRALFGVAGVAGGWLVLASILSLPVAFGLAVPFMVCAWFATRAWLPLRRARRWRMGAVWAQVTLALGLFMGAALTAMGTLRGSAQHLLLVATILLVFTASQALPLLRALLRRRFEVEPRASTRATAVLLVLAIMFGIGALVDRQASQPVRVEDTPAAQALAQLAAEVDGAPVLVGAPQSVSMAASMSGMPALIAAPETEQRLRNVLQPAVGNVINDRLQAVGDIYSGDVERARQALATYHVDYVLLGPSERAAFPDADTALQALTLNGILQPAHEDASVQIYRHVQQAGPPPFVLQPVQYDLPSTKTLLLDQPVNQLPVVDEYGWNRAASEAQWRGIILWLLLLEGLGLLAFPLANAVFGRWHDRGWASSKLIGLLVWGYVVWLPVSLGWWLFDRWALAWGVLFVAGLSAVALARRRRTGWSRLLPSRGTLLRSEASFLIAWGAWALVRAANPDLWHPVYGGEKPFEFGFLNALLRSPVLPPYDPFFSGGIVNYYYYGLFLVALPIKATGIAPAIGFNLAIATLFALTTAAALGLGRQITGRWRYGLLAVLLLACSGPLASAFPVNESRGLWPVIDALGGGLDGFSGRINAWFWGPSRIIPYTINEFPLFAFLFADLHPHLIALPIALLGLSCVTDLGQRRWSMPLLALSALVLGTLAVANSWDAPTYALLIGGVLVGRTWQRERRQLSPWHMLVALGFATLVALGITLVGLALYTPFFVHYRAMVGGIGIVAAGDQIRQWVLWFGPLLFVIFPFFGCLLWHTARRASIERHVLARVGRLALPLLVAVVLLSGWAMQGQTAGWPLRLMLALFALLGFALLLLPRLSSQSWLPLWIITIGVCVALGIQFIFIRDHLAGGTHERMNTVFKFGFQIWTLWALGAATALPAIIRLRRRYEIVLGVWLGLGLVLLLPSLLYPLVGLPSRLGTRFDPSLPPTLDGLAFMRHAHYEHEGQQIDLRADAEAIAWLNDNIDGTTVLLTSEREFYRTYGMRIAANTGLPTVLGRLHQDEQRPPEQVIAREHDVQTLLNTADLDTTLRLLAKYRVDYVYIGPVERTLYEPAGVAKWEQMRGPVLYPVYQNESVSIYRVRPEALANVSAADLPPVVVDDIQTQTQEQETAVDPSDAGAAFGLAERYLEVGKLDDAARVLQTAAQANPSDVPIHHLLGDVLAQLGRDDEAVLAWSHAAEVDRTALNLNKLGQGLIQLRRWEAAEHALNEALALDPSLSDPYFSLGELYRNRNNVGDTERAVQNYGRYLELTPPDAPWRDLAEAYIVELSR